MDNLVEKRTELNPDSNNKNNIIIENNITNINENTPTKINEENLDNKTEINETTKAIINRKITTIKTIQSIAIFVNKLLLNNSSINEIEESNKNNLDNNLFIPKNKVDFDEIKRKFFEPLIPYIEQYKKKCLFCIYYNVLLLFLKKSIEKKKKNYYKK